MYKLFTKILVNRLKLLIAKQISPNQNNLIKGSGPDINLIVASEVLHSMNKKKGDWARVALKIDLEKAYNRVEWTFMPDCLRVHSLDKDSICLIMDYISKASSSVLINGHKVKNFKHSRGLRQGYLMSRNLFNICLKSMSQMIHKVCDEGNWTRFGVAK